MLLAALSMAAGSLWTWQTFAVEHAQPWLVFLITAAVLGLLLGVATVWMPWSVARIGAAQFLYSTLVAVAIGRPHRCDRLCGVPTGSTPCCFAFWAVASSVPTRNRSKRKFARS